MTSIHPSKVSLMSSVYKVLLLLQLFVVSAVQGQTFYVRPGATGANNGSNWTNAFTALPATLQRGAVYYVAGGTYEPYTFDDALAGTQTITIKKATVADHGTNAGWADAYGTQTAVFGSPFVFLTGYHVVDGVSRNADWRGGYGIKIAASASQSKAVDMSQAGSTHNTFKYVEIQGAGLDNSLHDDGFYAFTQHNLKIQYCYLHDFGRCPILTGYCNNWLVEYCLIARNSSSAAIHSEGWASQSDNNHIIRHNIWEDIEGTGFIVCLNRNSEVNINANWEIYGNVFCYTPGNPYHREGVGDGTIAVINKQVAQNWKIYNNSFVNITTGIPGAGISSRVEIGANWATGMPNNSNIQIYNNFWWKSDPAGHLLESCTSCTAQHNRYDQTVHNTEPNIEVTSFSNPSVFVNYTGKDFRLTAPTQPGVGLPSPYNVDLLGVTRGLNGIWDRGAYEY